MDNLGITTKQIRFFVYCFTGFYLINICNSCHLEGALVFIPFPSFSLQSTPRLVKALSRRFITSVAAGSEFTVCVDAEGQVFAWGKADGGQVF